MPEIKELIKQLGADQETAYRANKALYEMATRASAPGSDDSRQELAKALAGELTARKGDKKEQFAHSAPVRSKITRLLAFVVGDGQVAALTETLRDLDVREMARIALDFNTTSSAATNALLQALDDVGPEFRIGIVGALGRRNDPQVVPVLQNLARSDTDSAVRITAIEELSHYPDPATDALIAQAMSGDNRGRALVARIHLAETLRKAGRSDEAKKIYRAIQDSDADPRQKRAAEIGLKAIA